MDVEHFLARAGSVVLEDVDAFGTDGLLDRGRQQRNVPRQVRRLVGGHLVDRLVVCLRDEKRVPRRNGPDVQEGQAQAVLEDLRAGDFARDDLAEDAVGHREPSRPRW